jgi:UDP-2,3-diacylglucosamine pyrophosphatase LpxH
MQSSKVVTVTTEGPTAGLVPTGDWHWGHERCDTKGVREVLAQAEENQDAILLMGDLGDYGLSNSPGASVYEQLSNPQDQKDEIQQILEPYTDLLVGLIAGNHEERIRKRTGFDISRELAGDLGVPYLGYGGVIRLVVGSKGFTIFAKHGKSGAATLGGKVAAIMKYRHLFPDADVYLMGHVHHLMYIPDEARAYNTRNKTVGKRRQHFILTGHLLHEL